jgi:hypothetical protein
MGCFVQKESKLISLAEEERAMPISRRKKWAEVLFGSLWTRK